MMVNENVTNPTPPGEPAATLPESTDAPPAPVPTDQTAAAMLRDPATAQAFQDFLNARSGPGDPTVRGLVPSIGGGVSPATGQIVPDPSPAALAQGQAPAPAGRRFSGRPGEETVRVESTERNQAGRAAQGADAHEFTIATDGYGHYWIANGPADAPHFDSRDAAVDWLTGEHVTGTLVE